jgi:hypothetical protein
MVNIIYIDLYESKQYKLAYSMRAESHHRRTYFNCVATSSLFYAMGHLFMAINAAHCSICACLHSCCGKCGKHCPAARFVRVICISTRHEWLCQRGSGARLTRSALDKSRSTICPHAAARSENMPGDILGCLSVSRQILSLPPFCTPR